MSPQISNAIRDALARSVVSRVIEGEADPESVSWVFTALFVSFLLFAFLLIVRILRIERRLKEVGDQMDSSDQLPAVDD